MTFEHLIKRREIIAMGLAASCKAITHPFALQQMRSSVAEIKNRFLKVRFDADSGFLCAWLADGSSLLVNAVVRAVAPSWTCASSSRELARKVWTEQIRDSLGPGVRIFADCVNQRHKFTLTIEISLYEERSALLVECRVRNDSSSELALTALEPLRAVAEESGLCTWKYAEKSLTNGYLYADPGNLNDFSQTRNRPQTSVWNMGFAGEVDQPGLAVGFVEGDFATGKIQAAVGSTQAADGFTLTGEAFLNREFVVKPGRSARSGRFALQFASDPFIALEEYAQMVGDAHRVRLGSIINGWCNWFYDHTNTSEDEIVRNAEFAARRLQPYGLEWIQIDDGYERALGDWEGNERFPHGMKWLAKEIRKLGLRPGLWIAPYVISEGTEVYRHHPDWLIRNLDGSPRLCGNRGNEKLYGLDISVPAAAAWLHDLIHQITTDWGYDFLKIDFVEWSLLSADRFQDPTWSRAYAYRKGAEVIRSAMGPDRHLLDCGPPQMSVGLIDSTRIELDQPFLTYRQYVGAFNSNAPAAAKRYYFHKRAWINDADHLGVALLTPSQAEVAASIIALSGGTMICGDRLRDLDDQRLTTIQKVFPSFGVAARPIDLFDRERPEIFVLSVEMPFEKWIVVGLFNFEEGGAVEKRVSLSMLRLNPHENRLAFEFWQQRFLGRIRDDLRVLVPPASVALVGLRNDHEAPQILSTDRHFTQGGVELRDVRWDAERNTLNGTSLGSLGTRHSVLIHIPLGYALGREHTSAYGLAPEAPEIPHDFDGYSVTLLPNGLARLAINFAKHVEVPWRLAFKRLTTAA